jgi:hypothetical protein
MRPPDRIRADASGERISMIDLDPRVLRLTPAEVGRDVRDAVNAALAAERADLARVFADQPGPAELARTLARTDDGELLGTLRLHTELASALAAAGLGGADDGIDWRYQELLADEMADIAGRLARTAASPPPEATGWFADAEVRVAVAGRGRVGAVEVTYGALTMQSRDLAARLVRAVNAALDDATANARRAAGAPVTGVTERIAALADESRNYFERQAAATATVLARIRRLRSEVTGG